MRNPNGDSTINWSNIYLGLVDYSTIILWVLENAKHGAFALATSSKTTTWMGVGAISAMGAVAMGVIGPVAVARLTIVAFGIVAGLITVTLGAVVASGVATNKGAGRDALTVTYYLGEEFYKVILQ